LLGKGVLGDFSYTDGGYGQGFYAPPKETSEYSPQWTTGTWYHNVIAYDGILGTATLTTTNLANGNGVYEQTLSGLALSSDYNRLGVSRLFMEGYTSNAVDYNIDNVMLSQAVPEPSTLVLLGTSTLSLLAYVWRRRRHTA
jgi:hypothetical protein